MDTYMSSNLPSLPTLPTISKLPEVPKLPGISYVPKTAQDLQYIQRQREYREKQQAYNKLYSNTQDVNQVNSLLDVVTHSIGDIHASEASLWDAFKIIDANYKEYRGRTNLFGLLEQAYKSPYISYGDAFKAIVPNKLSSFGEDVDVLAFPVKAAWSTVLPNQMETSGWNPKAHSFWETVGAAYGIGNRGRRYNFDFDFNFDWLNYKTKRGKERNPLRAAEIAANWTMEMLSDPLNIIEMVLSGGISSVLKTAGSEALQGTPTQIVKEIIKNTDSKQIERMGLELGRYFINGDFEGFDTLLKNTIRNNIQILLNGSNEDVITSFAKSIKGLDLADDASLSAIRDALTAYVKQDGMLEEFSNVLWKNLSNGITERMSLNVLQGVNNFYNIVEDIDAGITYAANPTMGVAMRLGVPAVLNKTLSLGAGGVFNTIVKVLDYKLDRSLGAYKIPGAEDLGYNLFDIEGIKNAITSAANGIKFNKVFSADVVNASAERIFKKDISKSVTLQLQAISVALKDIDKFDKLSECQVIKDTIFKITNGTITDISEYLETVKKNFEENPILRDLNTNAIIIETIEAMERAAAFDKYMLDKASVESLISITNILQKSLERWQYVVERGGKWTKDKLIQLFSTVVKEDGSLEVSKGAWQIINDLDLLIKTIDNIDPEELNKLDLRSIDELTNFRKSIYALYALTLTDENIDFDLSEFFKDFNYYRRYLTRLIENINKINRKREQSAKICSALSELLTENMTPSEVLDLMLKDSELYIKDRSASISDDTLVKSFDENIDSELLEITPEKVIKVERANIAPLSYTITEETLLANKEKYYNSDVVKLISKIDAARKRNKLSPAIIKEILVDPAIKPLMKEILADPAIKPLMKEILVDPAIKPLMKEILVDPAIKPLMKEILADLEIKPLSEADLFNFIQQIGLKVSSLATRAIGQIDDNILDIMIKSYNDLMSELVSDINIDLPELSAETLTVADVKVYEEYYRLLKERTTEALSTIRANHLSVTDNEFSINESAYKTLQDYVNQQLRAIDNILGYRKLELDQQKALKTIQMERMHRFNELLYGRGTSSVCELLQNKALTNVLDSQEAQLENLKLLMEDSTVQRTTLENLFQQKRGAIDSLYYTLFGQDEELPINIRDEVEQINEAIREYNKNISNTKVYNQSLRPKIGWAPRIYEHHYDPISEDALSELVAIQEALDGTNTKYLDDYLNNTAQSQIEHLTSICDAYKALKTFGSYVDYQRAFYNEAVLTIGDPTITAAFIEVFQNYGMTNPEVFLDAYARGSILDQMQLNLDTKVKQHPVSLEYYRSLLYSDPSVQKKWNAMFKDQATADLAREFVSNEEHANPGADILLALLMCNIVDEKRYGTITNSNTKTFFFDIETIRPNGTVNGVSAGSVNKHTGHVSQFAAWDSSKRKIVVYRLDPIKNPDIKYAPLDDRFKDFYEVRPVETEKQLIDTWISLAERSTRIVNTNSHAFDIPFMRAKYNKLRTDDDPVWESLSVYRNILSKGLNNIDLLDIAREHYGIPTISAKKRGIIDDLVRHYAIAQINLGKSQMQDMGFDEVFEAIRVLEKSNVFAASKDNSLNDATGTLLATIKYAKEDLIAQREDKLSQKDSGYLVDITKMHYKDSDNAAWLERRMRNVGLISETEILDDYLRTKYPGFEGDPTEYAKDQFWRKMMLYTAYLNENKNVQDVLSFEDWEAKYLKGSDLNSINDILVPINLDKKGRRVYRHPYYGTKNVTDTVYSTYKEDPDRIFKSTVGTITSQAIQNKKHFIIEKIKSIVNKRIKSMDYIYELDALKDVYDIHDRTTLYESLVKYIDLLKDKGYASFNWISEINLDRVDNWSDEELFAVWYCVMTQRTDNIDSLKVDLFGKDNVSDNNEFLLDAECAQMIDERVFHFIEREAFKPIDAEESLVDMDMAIHRMPKFSITEVFQNVAWDCLSAIQRFNRFRSYLGFYSDGAAKQYAVDNLMTRFKNLTNKIKIATPEERIALSKDLTNLGTELTRARIYNFCNNVITESGDINIEYLFSEMCFNNVPIITLALPYRADGNDPLVRIMNYTISAFENNGIMLKGKHVNVRRSGNNLVLTLDASAAPSLDFTKGTGKIGDVEFTKTKPQILQLNPAIQRQYLSSEDIETFNSMLSIIGQNSSFNGVGRPITEAWYKQQIDYLFKDPASEVMSPETLTKTGFFNDTRRFDGGTYRLPGSGWYGDESTSFFSNISQAFGAALNSMSAKSLYLNSIFCKENQTYIGLVNPNTGKIDSGFFRGLTYEEVAKLARENDEVVFLKIVADDSLQGYHVVRMPCVTAKQVEQAAKDGAVLVPYQMYLSGFSEINNAPTLYKNKHNVDITKLSQEEYTAEIRHRPQYWERLMVYAYKVGYLGLSASAWVRNFIDSNLKAVLDTGSPEAIPNYFKAQRRLKQYERSNQEIIEIYKALNDADVDAVRKFLTERVQDKKSVVNNMQRYYNRGQLNAAVKATDTWKLLDRIFQAEGLFNEVNAIDYLMQLWGDSRTLIWDSSHINAFFDYCEKANIKLKLTRDEYMFVKAFYNQGAELGLTSSIAKYMKEQYHKYDQGKQDPVEAILEGSSKLLEPMSQIESSVRFGHYLTLIDQGVCTSEAMYRVSKAQFDYNNKTTFDRYAELIIPFYTFRKMNTVYWADNFANMPMLMRTMMDLYKANYYAYDVDPDEYRRNLGLKYHINAGNVPITEDFVLKLNPSYMDAINMLFNPIQGVYDSILSPAQDLLSAASEGFMAARSYSDDGGEAFKDLLKNSPFGWQSLPIVDKLYTSYFGKDSTAQKTRSRMTNEPIQRIIGEHFPGMFGSILRYEDYRSSYSYTTSYKSSPYQYQNRKSFYPNRVHRYYAPSRPKRFLSSAFKEFSRKTLKWGFYFHPQHFKAEFQ